MVGVSDCANPPSSQDEGDAAVLRAVLLDFRTGDSLDLPWGFDPSLLKQEARLFDLEHEDDLIEPHPRERRQRSRVASEAGYAIVKAEPILRCAWGNMSPEAFFGDTLYRRHRIEIGCFDLGETSVVLSSRISRDERSEDPGAPDTAGTIRLLQAENRGLSGSAQFFEYELRKRGGQWVVVEERLLEAQD